MSRIRLKYLHCFNDRHGKPHCYFRYRGQQWSLPSPGTEGFASAYDALLANIKANPFAVRRNVEFMPGSLAWAIEKFLASPLYNERAETTRRNYRRVLHYGKATGPDICAIWSRVTSEELGTKWRRHPPLPPISQCL